MIHYYMLLSYGGEAVLNKFFKSVIQIHNRKPTNKGKLDVYLKRGSGNKRKCHMRKIMSRAGTITIVFK